MIPILPILGTAAAAIAGQIGDTLIQQDFNRKEAQKNRDFQERLANTAIQRQFADAEAAGISPAMLMANGASGLNSPSGTGTSAASSNIGGAMASTINALTSLMINDRKLDAYERMNSDRIDAREDLQHAYLINYNNIANRRMLNNWQINQDNLNYKKQVQHVTDFLTGKG